jgi:aminoglycoside phosphotransferase (APT) family kinase protein
VGEQDIGNLEDIRRAIEGWLQRRLADRPGLRIADLAFPKSSGESSVTLILDATWPDGAAEKLVLRMAPPKSQVFEKHDLRMQYQMMDLMRKEGVPAPPLLGYEPDRSLVGSDFYVMGFCDGRIPPDNPPMAIAGWVKEELSPEQRRTMWRNGLDVLARIHRIDIERHDLSRLPRAKPGEPLVAQELRTFDSMFKPALRASVEPTILEGWEQLMATPPESEGPALCWGDSRPGNVIFRDLEPVAIIDWEMANVSDPLTDLAWWVWIDKCNSEGLGVERLPGLPSPAEIYGHWRERTGRSIDAIAWFELFAVVRYAVILELKFLAMREANPEMGVPPNFAARFIPELMKAARAV